jgi:hypothetical protein
MDNSLIVQILAGLAFLFACFLTYMAAKGWRWFHVTAMFFVFVASMVFAVLAAYNLKARAAWVRVNQELEAAVEKAEADKEKLIVGDLSKLSSSVSGDYNRYQDLPVGFDTPDFVKASTGPGPLSINALSAMLNRVIADRGRVWRGCQVTGAREAAGLGEIDLSTVSAEPAPVAAPGVPPAAPPAAAAPVPNHLQPKDVVYAFKEMPDANGRMVPREYMGEYQVTAATDSTVSLRSTFPLDASQKSAAADTSKTWVLYEQMPVDDRELFRVAGNTVEERKNALQAILPLDSVTDQAVRDAILNEYALDGLPATDTHPAVNQYLKVTFLKEYEVVVNSSNPAEPLVQRFFDAQGRAISPDLQRSPDDKGVATVKFKGGEGAEFLKGAQVGATPAETIESLIESGVAKIDQTVYRRRLHDYATEFTMMHYRDQAIVEALRLLDIELASIAKTIENANTSITNLEADKEKLLADLTKVNYEREKVTEYAAKLTTELAETKAGLRTLYQQILQMRNDIADIQERITAEVDARSKVSAEASNAN